MLKRQFSQSSLSDEVLVLVFEYLSPRELVDQVPLVCKRWREICYDTKVWDILDLYHHEDITETELRKIVWLHSQTKRLILRNRNDLGDRTLVWCFFHLKNLRALDLSGCSQVGPKIVSAIVQFCKSLRNLNVNGCSGFDNECLLILTGCKKLRHLNFSECDTVTDFGFNAMTSFLPSLESVLCDGVMALHDEAIETIVTKKCATFTDLLLDGANLTDEGVQMLSELRFLRRLRIQYCDELSDEAIRHFSNLRYLEELSLTRAHTLTSSGIVSAFSRPHHFMRVVEITECSGLTDTGVSAIGRSCRNLEHLNISWSKHVTDDGIIALMDNSPHLKQMNVQSVKQLSDFVALIPHYCPELRYLNVISCSMVREDDLRQLSTALTELQIAYNRDLGCSPKSFRILRYFDIMSPRQFAISREVGFE